MEKFVFLIKSLFCFSKVFFLFFRSFFNRSKVFFNHSKVCFLLLKSLKKVIFIYSTISLSFFSSRVLPSCSVAFPALKGIRPSLTAFCGTYRKLWTREGCLQELEGRATAPRSLLRAPPSHLEALRCYSHHCPCVNTTHPEAADPEQEPPSPINQKREDCGDPPAGAFAAAETRAAPAFLAVRLSAVSSAVFFR